MRLAVNSGVLVLLPTRATLEEVLSRYSCVQHSTGHRNFHGPWFLLVVTAATIALHARSFPRRRCRSRHQPAPGTAHGPTACCFTPLFGPTGRLPCLSTT